MERGREKETSQKKILMETMRERGIKKEIIERMAKLLRKTRR